MLKPWNIGLHRDLAACQQQQRKIRKVELPEVNEKVAADYRSGFNIQLLREGHQKDEIAITLAVVQLPCWTHAHGA